MDKEGEYPLDKGKIIKAAKDLLYGQEVVEQLEKARTDEELTHIMARARKKRAETEDRINDAEIEKKRRKRRR